MSDKVGLVRVLTAATGNSTPITLGARYSDLFMTPAEAGAVDGRTYTWLIVDGNNWELVKGVYTASGTTAARTTVLASRSAGTLGTSRIVLSGTAQVRIVESAVDMDGVRGTRSVAGTSDTLASTDLGYVVTYSNAAAVAVSLAQAGTASLYDGWATWVQNTGVGTVTITPATSTINGAATLPLATNMGAFIWSDGTNYHAYFVPVSKPLLAANNLADVASAATARTNLGATTVGAAVFTAASAAAASTSLGTVSAIRVQKFTASGTYAPDPHLLYSVIESQAGGGSGGSVSVTASTSTIGSGGGGGAYARKLVTAAAIGVSQTVTVGAGGAAPAAGDNNGNAGGTTSVGSLCSASGGAGGPFAHASVSVSNGAAGGTTGTGDLVIPGGAGGGGFGGGGGGFLFVGWGGSSYFGGQVASALNSSGTSAPVNSGAGGSGANDLGAGNRPGGAGGSGLVVITEYCSQ
jgi:hypothetical protein